MKDYKGSLPEALGLTKKTADDISNYVESQRNKDKTVSETFSKINKKYRSQNKRSYGAYCLGISNSLHRNAPKELSGLLSSIFGTSRRVVFDAAVDAFLFLLITATGVTILIKMFVFGFSIISLATFLVDVILVVFLYKINH